MSTWAEAGPDGGAHHEAGHAVVGRHLGLRIHSVELGRGRGFTEVRVPLGQAELARPGDEPGTRDAVVFLAAGRAAEARYLTSVLGWSAGRAERVAEGDSSGDMDQERMLTAACPEADISALWVHQQAATLVDRWWDRIAELAAEVAEQGRVRGGRVR